MMAAARLAYSSSQCLPSEHAEMCKDVAGSMAWYWAAASTVMASLD